MPTDELPNGAAGLTAPLAAAAVGDPASVPSIGTPYPDRLAQHNRVIKFLLAIQLSVAVLEGLMVAYDAARHPGYWSGEWFTEDMAWFWVILLLPAATVFFVWLHRSIANVPSYDSSKLIDDDISRCLAGVADPLVNESAPPDTVWPPRPIGVDYADARPQFRALGSMGTALCAMLLIVAVAVGVAAGVGFEAVIAMNYDLWVGATVPALLFGLLPFAILTVSFPLWCRHAAQNINALGGHLPTTLGSIVATFFLPPINLIRPYLLLQQIWDGSKTRTPIRFAWSMGVALLSWWIITLLGAACLFGAFLPSITYVDAWENQAGFAWIGNACFVVSAICLIFIIRMIDTRQLARFRELNPPAPSQQQRDKSGV